MGVYSVNVSHLSLGSRSIRCVPLSQWLCIMFLIYRVQTFSNSHLHWLASSVLYCITRFIFLEAYYWSWHYLSRQFYIQWYIFCIYLIYLKILPAQTLFCWAITLQSHCKMYQHSWSAVVMKNIHTSGTTWAADQSLDFGASSRHSSISSFHVYAGSLLCSVIQHATNTLNYTLPQKNICFIFFIISHSNVDQF